MAKLTVERMLRAGFVLTDCEDGRFWALAEEPGQAADRIAAVCGEFLPDMDAAAVAEDIVLQCGSDYSDPALYMDGFLWSIPRREFSGIVARLGRPEKEKKPKRSLLELLRRPHRLEEPPETGETENEALP